MYFPALIGLLLAACVTAQHVDITPRTAVRRVGEELEVLCKVSYPIDSCRMTVGTTSYRLIPNQQEGDVVYHGQGLQFGECGATIKRIKEEWNGNVSCNLPPPSGAIELTATMRLMVARAPGSPQLLSPAQPSFREGDQFDAQCIVPNGRPAAKLTWLLDDIPVLVGIHEPIITTEPNSDLQTIKQNISRVLSADDAARRLVCRAEHPALASPMDAARQLTVYYPPRLSESDGGQITIFGLALGSSGRLNVTVRSAPPPDAVWRVGDVTIHAPSASHDGRLTALPPLALGNGYYNVTLVLSTINKEDVERVYYLRISNDLGHEELAVRISTMDEPAGVELDTGAIVGIVVAVLVLLAAISLLVFAKATNRWCFGDGRSRDTAKSSGESSDTESAVEGRAARTRRSMRDAANAASQRIHAIRNRVMNALPRRDRVQAQAGDDDKPAEEKKGVVYAELALGETQTGDKPPPPPATEYAEIVYTDQGEKQAKE